MELTHCSRWTEWREQNALNGLGKDFRKFMKYVYEQKHRYAYIIL